MCVRERETSLLINKRDHEGSGSFRPGSFQPILGVGRFGLGRWVVSAPSHFGPISLVYKHGLIFFVLFLVKVNAEMDRKIDRWTQHDIQIDR